MRMDEIEINNLVCKVDNFIERNMGSSLSDIITLDFASKTVLVKDSWGTYYTFPISDKCVHFLISDEHINR